MGEGEMRTEGMEMLLRAVFMPSRKVACTRVPTWRVVKEIMIEVGCDGGSWREKE